jgi:hypothetical protein
MNIKKLYREREDKVIREAVIGRGSILSKASRWVVQAIEQRLAEAVLGNEVRELKDILETRLPWVLKLDPVRQRAFFNILTDIGLVRLSGFGRLLTALHTEKWSVAADELRHTPWARQVSQSRLDRVAYMLETGIEHKV